MANEDNVARALRDSFNLQTEMESEQSWRSVFPEPHVPIMSVKVPRRPGPVC
jgi:hypothetical protein